MDNNQIFIIINTIVIAIYSIIVFRQNTTIKNQNITINSIKSFMEIFDINKVKEYTELRVEGEKLKIEIKNREIQSEYADQIKRKEDEINSLNRKYKNENDTDKKIIIVNQMSNAVQILLSVNLYKLLRSSIFCYARIRKFVEIKTDISTEDIDLLDGIITDFSIIMGTLFDNSKLILDVMDYTSHNHKKANNDIIIIHETMESIDYNIDKKNEMLIEFDKKYGFDEDLAAARIKKRQN